MKKKSGIFMIGLTIFIALFLYASYNHKFNNFLCNRINYCVNVSNDNTMSGFENIIYTTGIQLYDVSFDLSNGEQKALFDKYSETNPTCKVDGSYGIGGGPGCSNITGFTHTYTYPQLGLSLLAYGGIVGEQDMFYNPGLFVNYLDNPFLLRDNKVVYSWSQGERIMEESISYREFKQGETIESIIDQAKKQKINNIPYYNSNQIQPKDLQNFQKTDYTIYSINYINKEQTKYRNNLYIFQPGKMYYYVWDRESEETCIPVACGLSSHAITYFMK